MVRRRVAKAWRAAFLILAPLGALGVAGFFPPASAEPPAADPGLERARGQVQMLDALYKTAVVSVTNRYEGPPAIRMAKDVFDAMEKGGWHRARLVDATGTPLNESNLPRDDFERRAAAAMKDGSTYLELVVGEGTDRTLHAATVVPAVLKKCATCHAAKEGDLLGFVHYEIPIK